MGPERVIVHSLGRQMTLLRVSVRPTRQIVRATIRCFGAMFSGLNVRRLLVLISVILSLFVIVPTGSASAAVAQPLGALEVVHSNEFNNAVTMTGWALDPAARSRSTSVLVTVDGIPAGGWRVAAIFRADVNRSQAATGGHGFDIPMTVQSGKHIVCVTARTYVTPTATKGLGCFAYQAYPQATQAQMLAIAKDIDPKGTVAWMWSALPTGTAGQAHPWSNRIDIASGNSGHHLRAVMLHEWSHVLQYRAFGTIDPWWDAVQAFNALLGHPGDRSNYDGVEHGADCIAATLGADYLGYGCPAALRVFGASIAHGALMNRPKGFLDSVKAAGASQVTVVGWALDPLNPTTAGSYQVTDNGRPITTWLVTNQPRSDVNQALGVFGTHGVNVTVKMTPGQHRVCLTAKPVRTPGTVVTVGYCATVTTA